jgi:micrococcal nuclease
MRSFDVHLHVLRLRVVVRAMTRQRRRRGTLVATLATAAACIAAVAVFANSGVRVEMGPPVTAAPQSWSEPMTVVRVVDGDTFIVATPAGNEKVRLIGVDTPETVQPETPVECFGPEASAFTHQLLDGQDVLLSADPTQDDRDRYGRLLRYAQTVAGVQVNAELVRAGYAREYTYRDAYAQRAEFQLLERDAEISQRGLWGAC